MKTRKNSKSKIETPNKETAIEDEVAQPMSMKNCARRAFKLRPSRNNRTLIDDPLMKTKTNEGNTPEPEIQKIPISSKTEVKVPLLPL